MTAPAPDLDLASIRAGMRVRLRPWGSLLFRVIEVRERTLVVKSLGGRIGGTVHTSEVTGILPRT